MGGGEGDPSTLPQAYAKGPRGVLGEWAFSYGRGTPVGARTYWAVERVTDVPFVKVESIWID